MWGCFLMSGVKILHFLKDWWKSIPIHQNYTMALRSIKAYLCPNINFDSMDFSEHRPEEVISFFWRSVYVLL